jgi:hypothetical protein
MLILFIKGLYDLAHSSPGIAFEDRNMLCIFLALQLFLQTKTIYKKK